MFTLYEAGVPFRAIVHDDGTIECWQQPELLPWEVPKRDPHERQPQAPDWERSLRRRRLPGWRRRVTMPRTLASPHTDIDGSALRAGAAQTEL
jgi:hypothetical protein